MVFDKPGRTWFNYIQNTEKKKSPDNCGDRARQKGHGDQIPHDFIDDNFGAILLFPNYLRLFRCPPSQKKGRSRTQQIDGGGEIGEHHINEDANEGTGSTRNEREVSAIPCGGQPDDKMTQFDPQ